jgi:hypothetical protein
VLGKYENICFDRSRFLQKPPKYTGKTQNSEKALPTTNKQQKCGALSVMWQNFGEKKESTVYKQETKYFSQTTPIQSQIASL